MDRLLGLARIAVGFTLILLYAVVWTVALVPLLPFRQVRIKACNLFGSAAGSTALALSGCPLTITGREQARGPAIYLSNHTSVLDVFLGMWLSPMGTVGVAKKEIVYYPLIGQVYLLSGHLRIDRSDRESAVISLDALTRYVRAKGLSIFMWPEGTRSRSGQLLPLKKGFVHLAVHTGLPIVPMVVRGAQLAWEKSTLSVRPTPIQVEFLPPVDTTGWSVDTMAEHLDEVYGVFWDALPPEQRPAERHVAAA